MWLVELTILGNGPENRHKAKGKSGVRKNKRLTMM